MANEVIVKLMGGLGNQMFQYAAGRHLANKNKTNLKLDLSYLNNTPVGDTKRKYELNVFNISECFTEEKEVQKYFKVKPKSFFKKIGYKVSKAFNQKHIVVREKGSFFDDSFFSNRGKCYLEGFWQSEKYFLDIEDVIRSEFTFKNPVHPELLSVYNNILSTEAVSIHVRRGDYVTNKAANTFHGLCSLDYYNEAIKIVAGRVEKAHFYFFSDDIDWVKNNLKIHLPHTFIVNHGNVPDYEDLRLMSSCKHHIIANSSFSWWGAWLNPSKQKNVIAPEKWFAGNHHVKDLIPENWEKIKC